MKTSRILTSTRPRGFSLLEMAVALTILALLAVALWKFIPQWRVVDETQSPQTQLAVADEAIVGFVMTHYRLPCPDVDGDGKEDRTPSNDGCANPVGGFPFQTLGTHSRPLLRYAVHQDGALTSLTRAAARHAPPLPPPPQATTEWPLTGTGNYTPGSLDTSGLGAIPSDYDPGVGNLEPGDLKNLSTLAGVDLSRTSPPGFSQVESTINGLDFCAALRDVQLAPSHVLAAGGIPVAYLVVHPGAGDADNNGSFFDLGNDDGLLTFEAPGRAMAQNYDDQVLAVGFGELAARLSCPSYLSRANASGHTASAAYDNFRVALALLQFQAFAYDMAYLDMQSAYTGVVFGVASVVTATASAVFVGAAGVMTADEGVGAALIIAAGIIVGVAGVVEAIIELGFAIAGLVDAVEAMGEAAGKRIEAEVYAHKMLAVADETVKRAVAINLKGLLP
ncbi:MAG: prepilin-type N-terminal cleavage/methylation domain-containing protein [Burkholderiales bacterium]|jgi:prepilin-type N-terminal cleavage/methylation domain-containing protein|nr:prepilin-type N-terminal cleavage/methylation domain-containing protein [Burkholderiales bacterium]